MMDDLTAQVEGLVVPIHQSVIDRIMLAGVPRNVCFLLWTSVAAMGFGMRQLWIVPIGAIIHIILKMAAANDPYFYEIFMMEMKAPSDPLQP